MDCFVYDWKVVHSDSRDVLFAFGVDPEGKSTLARINYNPVCHILLSRTFEIFHIKELQSIIRKKMYFSPPLKMVVVERFRFYGAHVDNDNKRIKFRYLQCTFKSRKDVFYLQKILQQLKPEETILSNFQFKVCDVDANPILQFTSICQLNTCGWIRLENPSRCIKSISSLCDIDCQVDLITNSNLNLQPQLTVCSFDIECVPEDRCKFPNASMPNDVCFQISCVLYKNGATENHLLTLAPCEPIPGAHVTCFDSESQLLIGFSKFLRQHKVHIIVGYNIFQFDIPYLIERSKQTLCFGEFCIQGFLTHTPCKERDIKWSSSAYQTQHYKFLDNDGRVFIDLLPVVQKEYKLENYKLDTVSKHFLKDSKNDLSPTEMFKAFDERTPSSMANIGKYCIQDSALVLRLFNTLQCFYSLQEMANVCRVPISTLLLYGQQIKVYSQIYQYCVNNCFVIEKPDYVIKSDERYRGAMVFEPIADLYENVVPFDFNSLYPTCIIANNFDYSTFVDQQSSIPDEKCNIFEWEDHVGCVHDTKSGASKQFMCQKRRYRFLKEPKGILPTIIQELLDKRKETRKMLATEKDPVARLVLNQRQLAYKVSANSMYGITGVRVGMLPLMPVAMCITYMGRNYVEAASQIIKKDFGGDIVYGDTDSNYIIFPHIQIEDLYNYASEVSKKVSSRFPPPIYLEFEDAVYRKFLIFTKKRYVYQTINRNLQLDSKLGKTGVLLIRRDTFQFLKNTYETTIQYIFNNHSDIVLDYISDQIYKLLTRQETASLFMTKSFNDFSGEAKDGKLGHYKVKGTEEERDKQYYISQLPALCQLANKILERGNYKFEGRRLEYVILRGKGKQCDKIEHVDYFQQHRSELSLDYFYYFERMIEPMDQIIETVFKKSNFMKNMYIYHYKYKGAVLKEISNLTRPHFVFKK